MAKKVILLILLVLLSLFPLIFWLQEILYAQAAATIIYLLSRMFALVGFVALFLQFLIGAKLKVLERGIGLDKMFKLHRKMGIGGWTLVFLHLTVMLIFELGIIGSLSLSIPKLVGIVSFMLLTLTALVALFYKRFGMRYETWKYIHWLNYAIIIAVFIHSVLMGSTLSSYPLLLGYWIALISVFGIVMLYKLIHFLLREKRRYQVVSVTPETHDINVLELSGPMIRHDPGQFLFIAPVHNGKRLPSHPFTISSAPGEETVKLSIKEVGDFTSKIKDFGSNDFAYIDAPYGAFTLPDDESLDLVFLAGGIGITPFMSMLRYLAARESSRPILLIWGNKTKKDIAFKDELEAMQEKLAQFKIVHVMSDDEEWKGEKGFIDKKLLDKYIDSYKGKAYFFCGPPIMMQKLKRLFDEIDITGSRVYFERFAL
jgi:predicted ferric reductase